MNKLKKGDVVCFEYADEICVGLITWIGAESVGAIYRDNSDWIVFVHPNKSDITKIGRL